MDEKDIWELVSRDSNTLTMHVESGTIVAKVDREDSSVTLSIKDGNGAILTLPLSPAESDYFNSWLTCTLSDIEDSD